MIDHPVLADLGRFGVRLGLDRLRSFLAYLGDPHLAFPVIHVAGTNGKGSVVRMLGAVLRAAGYRVGEYISPHLQQVNERININGSDISDLELSGILYELDAARRAWGEATLEDGTPVDRALTYFEMMTAAAFLAMQRSGVGVAVIEVGMGGRLDASNVVDPIVSVITSISMDHVEQLGPDIPSIAAEKAGIIKPGRPVVVGPLSPPAASVIRAIAHERGARFVQFDRDFRVNPGREGRFAWSGLGLTLRDLEVRLPGSHQLDNAGVAIAALELCGAVLPVSEAALREGLRSVVHAGRLEWLAPELLVDCAHNADGAQRLAAYLRELPWDRPRTLLLGMSGDKDARSVAVTLSAQVDRVLTTRCRHPRAVSPGDLASLLVGVGLPVLPAGDIEAALPLARDGRSLVIVAGSVFLAGATRDLVLG